MKFIVNLHSAALWILPTRVIAFPIFGPNPAAVWERLVKVSAEVAHDQLDGTALWHVAAAVKREKRYATEHNFEITHV